MWFSRAIFDRERDSNDGRVYELHIVSAEINDEAGTYGLLAFVVLDNVFLDAFLNVPAELLADRPIETAVHQAI